MQVTEVAQAIHKLSRFNSRTDDRVIMLWWNSSDIEDNLSREYDEDQLRKLWNSVINSSAVRDALEHAENIVEDALNEALFELDN
jgi:hypothetical protein